MTTLSIRRRDDKSMHDCLQRRGYLPPHGRGNEGKGGLNELTIDQRVKLEGIAREIRNSHLRAGLEIINVGRALTEAREILFGGFTRWLEDELDMSPRLAQHFMNIAVRFGDVPKLISGLSPTILYGLAAPSTPDKVVDAVFTRIQDGEVIKIKARKVARFKAGKELSGKL